MLMVLRNILPTTAIAAAAIITAIAEIICHCHRVSLLQHTLGQEHRPSNQVPTAAYLQSAKLRAKKSSGG